MRRCVSAVLGSAGGELMPAPIFHLGAWSLRVSYGLVLADHASDGRKAVIDLEQLASKHAADHPVWAWLASHRIERPIVAEAVG